MYLNYFPYRLNFKYPFRLSHTNRTGTDNLYIRFEDQGNVGWGECVFIPYYPEKHEHFKEIQSYFQAEWLSLPINELNLKLKNQFPNYTFCRAAFDIALHNLETKRKNCSIADLYQLNENLNETSFTIGISTEEEFEQKLTENADKAYFKLKVSEVEIERIVNQFIKSSQKLFTIDANQGFTDRNLALKWSYRLADLGVAYMEQPFHKDDFESHLWLKKRSPIPIIADESFQVFEDLEKIVHYFDGINLKVMKCGGIEAGYQSLMRAKEMELKTLIGCMSESSVACDASNGIASLADWVDLDGKYLITNDPFQLFTDEQEIIEHLQSNQLTNI